MKIDLRSDTVTKPSPAMLEAMIHAQVGDDVFEDDPTVKVLEDKLATIFGLEAGLFCPSGTMTNQIAIRIQTSPQDQVICDKLSHIYHYEGGGIAYNSLISTRLLDGDRGRISPEQIEENINIDDIHFPVSKLVSIENTMNKGGGCYYTIEQIANISKVCKKHQLSLHLDGARIFNALTESDYPATLLGQYCDTISVCLSKGLGAPVGSVLLSSHANIKKAKRVRKVLGGGMRQSGFLAAAGIYALDHHVERLKKDHARAKKIGAILLQQTYVEEVMPIDTNIIIFKLSEAFTSSDFLSSLSNYGIIAVPFGKNLVRFTLHLDITDKMVEHIQEALVDIRF